MGFRQTKEHLVGKGSFHQICVFLGQPRGVLDGDALLDAVAKAGVDGVEVDTWAMDLNKARMPEGAKVVAQDWYTKCCKDRGLIIPSLAAHLQGQVLGDEAGAETLQFQGGEALEAYREWRKTDHPPRNDPFFVPEAVAKVMKEQATEDLKAAGRIAWHLGQLQGRKVPVSSFTGAPCRLWRHWFPFPPIPQFLGGSPDKGGIPLFTWILGKPAGEQETLVDRAYEIMLARFGPIWTFFQNYPATQGGSEEDDILFGLEAHPSEIAMGDPESAAEFIKRIHGAGFSNVGFNFDPSHQEWQDVDPVAWIHEFGDYIWSVHFKGVAVRSRRQGYTRAGRLGGFKRFGTPTRTMDFVYAGCERDACAQEEIIVAFNQVGYDGALTMEEEDNDFDLLACLAAGLAKVRAMDLPPSKGAFDAAFARV